MRGATLPATFCSGSFAISTHAPHAGSDQLICSCSPRRVLFQPTLPMRGATWWTSSSRLRPGNFNPRSPCGERQNTRRTTTWTLRFQPTLPMRGATRKSRTLITCLKISTHAPHAGSDLARYAGQLYYPISTHAPHAGSDCSVQHRLHGVHISTHAPHAGSDQKEAKSNANLVYFNPRSPCGERRHYGPFNARPGDISTHAPHAGSDELPLEFTPMINHFNPRSPCGERRKSQNHTHQT